MSTPPPPIAHRDKTDATHDLAEHLEETAALACRFAKPWGAGEAARLAALWHDLGKYSAAFQKRIRGETEAHIRVIHAFAGAQLALDRLGKTGRPLAYVIAGHHAGLHDWSGEDSEDALKRMLAAPSHLRDATAGGTPADILATTATLAPLPPEIDASLWIRMLASAVFDADFLDTERFFDQGRSRDRSGWPDIADLLPRFEGGLAGKLAQTEPSPVDALRTEVLKACRGAAPLPPGRFSLTVPTGGGKTLSSLAFALHHAQANGLRRIIYAVPFTSIIEQSADVFRSVLGDDAVLEHHSAIEAGTETSRTRIAAENWDAPVIVTTTVQLFESLFASRTSRLRKLHNLAGSVLVLDEAQALPVGVLRPVTAILDQLTRHYRVSVVLCTATQPALHSVFKEFEPVTEIAPKPERLFKALERIRLEMHSDLRSWEDIAADMATEPQALAIVNTRAQCRDLLRLLPEGAIHLSTYQCASHRRTLLAEIRRRLDHGKPVRVVSTSLVEAGVDIDFPTVFRAMAGLDSLAQAAGRCNRNGRLPGLGRFVVFRPEGGVMRGHRSQVAEAAEQTLHSFEGAPFTPEAFEAYFNHLYRSKGDAALDAFEMTRLLRLPRPGFRPRGDRFDVSFRTAAKHFRMIDEERRIPIIVPHGAAGAAALLRLEKHGPNRDILRALQGFTVPIRPGELPAEALRDVHGFAVLADMDRYHEDVGLHSSRVLAST